MPIRVQTGLAFLFLRLVCILSPYNLAATVRYDDLTRLLPWKAEKAPHLISDTQSNHRM